MTAHAARRLCLPPHLSAPDSQGSSTRELLSVLVMFGRNSAPLCVAQIPPD